MSEDNTLEKMPKHVAIIMDGNGRWAKKRGMNRTFGHQSAIKAVREAIEFCNDYNIPYLTLYTFSSENWKRPALEVNVLMNLLINTIKKETKKLNENGVRVKVIGNTEKLPKNVLTELNKLIENTKDNKKGTLILALSYSSKEEILAATKKIISEVINNQIQINQIDTNLFSNYLYTQNIPDVDLLIRTSGERRISNFLLWQIAYAELYFTDILWPDFNKEEFLNAIKFYQSRERRFGKTSEQLKIK
ncbi:isoprenyl transferase [Apibacter adventoris]|uniref:Isoprenyl transferase n=1 Tax=Apibacter adventoris TaxID=1679466 RepID=A0A2S8AGE3_9FLAO|nr:isoprenyl transferase [Apibacter adventoris]PQL92590.1 di-trans,poly-cis-decaprenylcistransferase [Apibacter adventoris]PQL95451.1 di-trans,poly-cis-decaprenylcistransferase [Apibacter adventoris]